MCCLKECIRPKIKRMSENPIRLQSLFNKYVQGSITAAEQEEFWGLMAEYDEKDLLDGELKALWVREAAGVRPSESVNWLRVEGRLDRLVTDSAVDYGRFQVKRMQWWKYAAAAVVVGVMVFAGKQLIRTGFGEKIQEVAKVDIPAPDKNRATITSNGKTVYVDQVKVGDAVLAEAGLKVVKQADGTVVYQVAGESGPGGVIPINTFSNPKGSQAASIRLADGSRIWLNAGSTVRYPMAFVAGRKRELELIAGEAYFEVKHDAKSPLVLKAGSEVIEDLGTSFNVNTYSTSGVRTTLVDGALRVNRKDLRPGEQYLNGLVSRPELEQVLAWKNGQFDFNEMNIEEVMKQAAVWYDVEVVFDGKVAEKFSFSVDRSKPISALLHAMELSGGVHFTVEGRTVHVQPNSR